MDHRPFNDACPIFRAADVFSDRCTLMILRDLFQDGDRTFGAFQAESRGFSPTTVSKRLKSLENDGFIEAELYQKNPPRLIYKLTKKGRQLGPILQAMHNWGQSQIDESAP